MEQLSTNMEKERAEKASDATLIEGVEDKSNEEKVKNLIDNNVSEELIIEIAKVDQQMIDPVNN